MLELKTPFDLERSRATVEKGRRANWWKRLGGSAKTFKYVAPDGKHITEAESLERIRTLAIPPAWTHVRVNPFSGGKVQAVGIDGTGRVQYRYHANFVAKQQRKKFAKIERFGMALPQLRQITNEHISLNGLPREKVLAVVMRLINSLYFRVGTDQSVRLYKTYGITTLQKRHLTIGKRGELIFDFIGKSHIQHRKIIVDTELAAIVRDLVNLGKGRRLFRYLNGNNDPKPVTPALINSYLKEAAGPEFSAKDFRTWGGTVLAASEFAALGPAPTAAEAKKNIVRVVKRVAEELGNTPTVCRGSYIHPVVIDAYAAGTTIDEFRPRKIRRVRHAIAELEPEERALMRLFESYGK